MSISNRRQLLQAAAGVTAAAAIPGVRVLAQTAVPAPELRFIAEEIRGPEGPSVLPDRSVSCVEFMPGNLLRVHPDGTKEILATPGSGIVGTVMGKDGYLYAAKLNAGTFMRRIGAREGGPPLAAPAGAGPDAPALVASPSAVLRVDLQSREVRTLYSTWNGAELPGPNDLVFDAWGDLWISDASGAAVFNARIDGSRIERMISDVPGVNGITLSPDKRTLYIFGNGRLLAYAISARGVLQSRDGKAEPVLAVEWPQAAGMPDGMKTEASGNILAASGENGIARLSPAGQLLSLTRFAGRRVINLAFSPYETRALYLAINPVGGMIGGLARVQWDAEGLA